MQRTYGVCLKHAHKPVNVPTGGCAGGVPCALKWRTHRPRCQQQTVRLNPLASSTAQNAIMRLVLRMAAAQQVNCLGQHRKLSCDI